MRSSENGQEIKSKKESMQVTEKLSEKKRNIIMKETLKWTRNIQEEFEDRNEVKSIKWTMKYLKTRREERKTKK